MVAMLAAGPAFAQCSPDQTVTDGTTTCAGIDTDGLTVATDTLVVVANGAIVRPGGAAAAITGRAGNVAFQIAGLVDGGAGTDTILVSGGSTATPVAFSAIANVEAFGMTGGYATIAGTVLLGSVDMSGGRLVGLSACRDRRSALGGIGIGNRDWSVGAFAGYLDSRQRIASLGAAPRTDGVVAGVHGRYTVGKIRIGASILYDGGHARRARCRGRAMRPGAMACTAGRATCRSAMRWRWRWRWRTTGR